MLVLDIYILKCNLCKFQNNFQHHYFSLQSVSHQKSFNFHSISHTFEMLWHFNSIFLCLDTTHIVPNREF